MAMKSFNQVPPLNNRELFHRDRQMCAYCATMFPIAKLTRDHVVPFSRAGGYVDERGDRLPRLQREEERSHAGAGGHGADLSAVCAEPRRYLILTNRRILADQMEFLAQHVPAQSRLHQKPV